MREHDHVIFPSTQLHTLWHALLAYCYYYIIIQFLRAWPRAWTKIHVIIYTKRIIYAFLLILVSSAQHLDLLQFYQQVFYIFIWAFHFPFLLLFSYLLLISYIYIVCVNSPNFYLIYITNHLIIIYHLIRWFWSWACSIQTIINKIDMIFTINCPQY